VPRFRSSTYDAAGAVQGFGQALGQLLDEVAAWAAQAAAAREPAELPFVRKFFRLAMSIRT
jgi:hypothetical protein